MAVEQNKQLIETFNFESSRKANRNPNNRKESISKNRALIEIFAVELPGDECKPFREQKLNSD